MAVLIIITGIILLILFEAKLYKNRGLGGIEYSCRFEKDEVFEGETVEFTETVTNLKKLPLPGFKSEITASAALEFCETQTANAGNSSFISSFFSLGGRSSITRKWTVRCSEPGILCIENVTLVASDLLDLLSVSDKAQTKLPKLTVFPRRYIFEADIHGYAAEAEESFPSDDLISDPCCVNGVYEYDGSQPMRRINWHESAKLDEIMANRYEPLPQNGVSVILDCKSFTDKNALLHGMRVAAQTLRLAWGQNTELAAMCGYGGELLYTALPGSSGSFNEYLRLLAHVPGGEPIELSEAEKRTDPGFFKVIITGEPSGIPENFLTGKHLIISTRGGKEPYGSDCITVKEDEDGRTEP